MYNNYIRYLIIYTFKRLVIIECNLISNSRNIFVQDDGNKTDAPSIKVKSLCFSFINLYFI